MKYFRHLYLIIYKILKIFSLTQITISEKIILIIILLRLKIKIKHLPNSS